MLRSRLASLLLLLASPAMGGTVLPLAHPCPVDAPWLASGPGSGSEHQGHHGQSEAPSDDSGHTCTCPSDCTAGVTAAVVPDSAATLFHTTPVRRVTRAQNTPAEWTRSLLDRLPPSTAPPIA